MSYIIPMDKTPPETGNPSDQEIAEWVAEFEKRDPMEIVSRGRGRPKLAPEGSIPITLRFSKGELAALDAQAKRDGTTRSDIVRRAVALFFA